MTTQLFKNQVPNDFLFLLLDAICIKTDKYYILNRNAFKKGLYSDVFIKFLEDCKPYYHLSKRKYCSRKLTYKNIITVIRQICNNNSITYTSQIKYDKSVYEIVYFIYF